MKKLLLILLCFPMIGLGQDKSLELGLLYGGSLNSLNGLDSRDALTNNLSYKDYPLPVGGILVQYNFTNRFSIKSKFLYHIKGGGTVETLTSANDNSLTDFHYVTLPLLAQFNFGKKKWRFFCNTGVYLGSLIKEKSVYEEPEAHYEEESLEDFNKFDFGLILGCGASFQIFERMRVFIESSLENQKKEKVDYLKRKTSFLQPNNTIIVNLNLRYNNQKNSKKTINFG